MTAGAPVSPLGPAGKNPTRVRCAKIFAVGKNLDAGAIHSPRADQINRVEPPKGRRNPKKKHWQSQCFFFGKESQTRIRRKSPPRVRRSKHFCIAKILMPGGFIPPEQIK
nr:hypothetical protein [Pseudoflavonifractor sp. BIOML-A9]